MATTEIPEAPDRQHRPDSGSSDADDLEDLYNQPSVIGRNQARDLEDQFNQPDVENTQRYNPETSTYDPETAGTTQTPGNRNKSWRDRLGVGKKDKQVPGKEDLADKENSPDRSTSGASSANSETDKLGHGYRQNGLDDDTGRFSRFRSLLATRRRKTIFGSVVGGGIIGLIMTFSFLSGPFEFLHIAQLLQKTHFSHQQNAGDDRMGRMYRYARSGKVGETRVSYLGSKLHANMLADMEKIGIKPIYTGADIYQGFEIDRSSPNSPYKDMSNAELQSALEEKGVNIKELKISGAKATISVDGYRNQRTSLKFLADQANIDIVPTALRVRVLARYGLVTWHPLKILDKKANAKLSDLYNSWKEGRQKYLSGKTGNNSVATTGGQDETGDPKKPQAVGDTSTDLPPDKVQTTLKAIADSKSLKITGGLAAAAGVVCAAKAVNDNIGEIRFIQVMAPLMRMAMGVVTTAAQVMSGQAVDPTELSFLAKSFDGPDTTNPKSPVTSWSQAAAVNDARGQSGGIDIDQGTKDLVTQGSPSWLSWTNSSEVGALCSSIGTTVTGVFSVGLGIITGGIASTVGGAVASALIVPGVIERLSKVLAGQAVDVLASGAQWGNYVSYGSRLAGNAMSLVFGGVALTAGQVAQLNADENAIDQADFRSQSLAHRIFSPTDQRSAISQLIDNSSSSASQNFTKMGSFFTGLGHTFSPLFGLATAHASAASNYQYGFPEYGFSGSDLNNPAVADPYANAEDVAKLLDNGDPHGYIDKAKKCFGVNITNTSQGWDVVPGDSPVNPNDGKYNSGDCADSGNTEWLKVRFFIMDTGVMEGYGCYQGDDQSCQNDGMGASAGGSNVTTASSSVDTAHIFDDSSSVSCASGTNDLGIQDGYHDGQLVKIRVCAVSNLASTSEESNGGYGMPDAGGKVIVNSRVSGAVYTLVQAANSNGVSLSASSGFRTMTHQQTLFNQNPDPSRVARPGYSNHQMGLAIDFAGLPSTPGPVSGNSIWDWLSQNAANFGYKNYPAEAWHWSVTGN